MHRVHMQTAFQAFEQIHSAGSARLHNCLFFSECQVDFIKIVFSLFSWNGADLGGGIVSCPAKFHLFRHFFPVKVAMGSLVFLNSFNPRR